MKVRFGERILEGKTRKDIIDLINLLVSDEENRKRFQEMLAAGMVTVLEE